MLVKELEALGFSDKEAKIYIALLEMGEATPLQLSLKSGLNRTTTYVILEKFQKQNLVKQQRTKKRIIFILNQPTQILELLESQKQQLERKISLVKKILPQMQTLKLLTSERAKMKFFEGRDGVTLIQKDFVKSRPKSFETIYNLNHTIKNFPSAPNDHRRIIENRKIKGRSIAVYDPKLPLPYLRPLKNEERRYLPVDKFPFYVDFSIYKNKAALVSFKDNMLGVVIENEAIVSGLRILFDAFWQNTDKYKIFSRKINKKKP